MRHIVIFSLLFGILTTSANPSILTQKQQVEAQFTSFSQQYGELNFWDKIPLLLPKFRMQLIINKMGRLKNKIEEIQLENPNQDKIDALYLKISDLVKDFRQIYFSL